MGSPAPHPFFLLPHLVLPLQRPHLDLDILSPSPAPPPSSPFPPPALPQLSPPQPPSPNLPPRRFLHLPTSAALQGRLLMIDPYILLVSSSKVPDQCFLRN